MLVLEPELIKEVLSKNLVFQKNTNPLGRLLTRGVATYEADKWAKHRRLINPAFQIEKLKVRNSYNFYLYIIYITILTFPANASIILLELLRYAEQMGGDCA